MKKKKKSSEVDGEGRQFTGSDISEERIGQAREYVENEIERDLIYVPDYISINNNKPVKV